MVEEQRREITWLKRMVLINWHFIFNLTPEYRFCCPLWKRIYLQNIAEKLYDMHNYVFISVQLPENKNSSVFVTLERAFYVYRG